MVLKQSWLFGLWLGLSMFSGQHDLKARPLPQSHRTYQTAYAVFVNVAYSFGDGRGIPKFEIIAKGKKKNPLISRYFPSPVPTVQMSEEVVAMCLTSGADSLNALAFILGHELAHHFKRHALLGMGDSNTKSIDVQESRKLEGEADYFGCFYAQIAGYQPVSAGISILDKIYKAYDLENQERGYPPLEDRQETLVKVKKMIAPLTSVFQAGQLLYVRGNYEVAYICFEYLVDRFPSRELYSNLGCAYLQAYLHQFPSDQQGFIYPLEFDARTRLEKPVPVRVRGQPSKAPDPALIYKAIEKLEKAVSLDTSYWQARINLACAYLLAGNPEAAIGKINERPNPPSGAHTVKGIAYFRLNDKKAGAEFDMAVKTKGYYAAFNRTYFAAKRKASVFEYPAFVKRYFGDKEIVRPPVSRKAPVPQSTSELPPIDQTLLISNSPYVVIRTYLGTTSLNFEVQMDGNKFRWNQNPSKILLSDKKEPKVLQIGSSSTEVQFGLGKPDYRFATVNGTFWCYKEMGLIVKYDFQKKVSYWVSTN